MVLEKVNSKSLTDGDLDILIEKADRFMLYILWGHLPIAGILVPLSYGTWKEGLIASLFLNIIGTISYIFSKGSFGHRILNGLLLLSYSVVLISLQYGRIEMHFHVFAALPFLILYRDWRVIPPAAFLIAIHHAAFNYCQVNDVEVLGFPLIVFNYGNGWDIVFLHSLFVIVEAGALAYYSLLLKTQYLDIQNINQNLEQLVLKRTRSLKNEKEKIEAYKNSLDKVAITAIIDPAGKIEEVNRNFEIISEYQKEELNGKDYIFNEQMTHFDSHANEVLKDLKYGHVWRGELESTSKSGDNFWVEAAITPLRDLDDRISNYMYIGFDITHKKEQQDIILKQREQIISQAKLSSLGEMAGSIAHEINNPLAVITLKMRAVKKMIAKDMVNTEKFVKALTDIDNTIVRITKIINGLRNVSRSGDDSDFDLCTMQDLIDDLLPLCSEKFKNHNINLKVFVDDSLSSYRLKLLRVQIVQVLLNLLTNAFDALTELNSPDKWIEISFQLNDKNVQISVTDSGDGIPVDVQEKIFQPFFTTKDFGKGTGVGLSLSYSIIQKHNGEFFIDKNCKNTRFIIKLPRE